jgi:hypothetical protein
MKAAMLIIKDDLTGVEIRILLETHFAGILAIRTDVQAATEGLTLNAHISCYAITPLVVPAKAGIQHPNVPYPRRPRENRLVRCWIPASAGMTRGELNRTLRKSFSAVS